MPFLYELRGKSLTDLIKKIHDEKFLYKYGWCYLDMLTTLIRKRIHGKVTPNHWTKLSTKKLKARYGQVGGNGSREWVYALVRRDLITWDVLMQHTVQVKKDERRADYKIRDERWAEGFQLSQVVLPRAVAQDQVQPVVRAKGVHGKLQTILTKNVTIDYKAALAFCDQARLTAMPLKDKAIDWKELGESKSYAKFRNRRVDDEVYSLWLYHVNRYVAGDMRFKHCETTGRDFTTVTATPSHLRPFILLDKEPVVESDVRCAQPLLFTTLVWAYCEAQGMSQLPADVTEWQQLCEQRDKDQSIYPNLFKRMIDAQVRMNCQRQVNPASGEISYSTTYSKSFKVEFFAQIFFDKDKDSHIRRVFAQHFPTVSAAITYWKSQPDVNLPVKLQQMEADLMLKQVCPVLLAKKIKVLSVHDALLTHPQHRDFVHATIRQAFLQTHGLSPAIL